MKRHWTNQHPNGVDLRKEYNLSYYLKEDTNLPFPLYNNLEKYIQKGGHSPLNVPDPEYNIKLYTMSSGKTKGNLADVTKSEIETSLRNQNYDGEFGQKRNTEVVQPKSKVQKLGFETVSEDSRSENQAISNLLVNTQSLQSLSVPMVSVE